MRQHEHIAFVGTSPINLLRAYLILKKHPNTQITFIDASDRIGGAWYTDLSVQGHEIESGCHIWSYEPKVYGFLRKEFDLPIQAIDPPAVFIGKNIHLPYSVKNSINSYTALAKRLLTFNFKGLKALSKNPAINYRVIGKKNQYPLLGSPMLINALARQLKSFPHVTFKFGSKIENIQFGDKVGIDLQDGRLEADFIYLTSVSHIQQISKEDQLIELSHERRDYDHLLIQLNKALKKKVFYWRIMNDAVIHRIADISYQTKQEEYLILIGIKEEAFNSLSKEELKNHCFNYMKSKKLVDDTFSFDILKSYQFPTYYISGEVRSAINQISPEQCYLSHSTDFIYGSYYLLKEYSAI